MNSSPPEKNRASRAYPFPGGIAGKLGDRFEAKWAVKKLFEVLLGDADALQFEFIDPTNYGVEFWLSRDRKREWYQAKRQNSQGNWTIGRLEKEGVLATALAKLSETENSTFLFVSETPATELGPLARRAALVETGADEFLNCLTEDERNGHLPALNRIWHTTTEQTWRYLRRLSVLVESEVNLDTDIRLLGGRVFSDSFDRFFPLLRDYLENNFNRELTSEVVRREIIEAGVLSPRTPLDPTLRERIARANQRYLESYTPFGAGGAVIPRHEAKEILEMLDAEDGPSIILLTGNAGTGKSGVVIHPFLDGNGRMARLLTVLLLYQNGYEVGRYISLERIVEQTKESYYDTLYVSSQGWHEGKHHILPWTEYLLGTILAAYREFEGRFGRISSGAGSKTDMVLNAIEGMVADFGISDLERACPMVSRDLIRHVLVTLRNEGKIMNLSKGKYAKWRKLKAVTNKLNVVTTG